jgi:hypothetical protein
MRYKFFVDNSSDFLCTGVECGYVLHEGRASLT